MAIDRDGADPVEFVKGTAGSEEEDSRASGTAYTTPRIPGATHLRKMSRDLGQSSGEPEMV